MSDKPDSKQSADGSPAGTPRNSDHDVNTPHARKIDPSEHDHDQLNDKTAQSEDRQEALIDEGVEETFPASDPVSAKRIT